MGLESLILEQKPDGHVDEKTDQEMEDSISASSSTASSVPLTRMRLWTTVYSVMASCMLSVLVGATLSYSSPVLLELEDESQKSDFQFNTALSDVFGAASLVCAIFGSLIGGIVADRFGRKTSLLLNFIPFLTGYLIITSSYIATNGVAYKALLIGGRGLTGVGLGWAYVSVPVYIAEISPARLRGMLVSLSGGVAETIGYTLVYSLGSINGFMYYNLALVLVGLTTVFVLMALWIPETPRWLLLKLKNEKAMTSLVCLRGPKYSQLNHELEAIEASISRQNPGVCEVIKEMFQDRSVLIPFLLILFLFVFQMLCGGGSTIESYASLIFEDAGSKTPVKVSIYTWGTTTFIGSVLATFLIEFAGRKILLSLSAAGMCLCSTTLGLYYYITKATNCINGTALVVGNGTVESTDEILCNSQIFPLAVVSILIFGMSFSLGLGAVPCVLLSEYLPLKVRGLAGGIVVSANWITASIITGSFLSYSDFVGEWFAWWTFSLINFFGFLVIVLFVVETKGRKLEELQDLFKHRSNPLKRYTLYVKKMLNPSYQDSNSYRKLPRDEDISTDEE